MVSTPPKPSFLLDTGPLSVLCGFPLRGTPYLHTVLDYAMIVLPTGVVAEVRASPGKIARTVLPLMKQGLIQALSAPRDPAILDTSYGEDLGVGERDVIKIALATGLPVVIDDRDAFIVACRFGLHPVGFQDWIVRLAKEYGLPKATAVEIVKATARQYPAMFLAHTLEMLS